MKKFIIGLTYIALITGFISCGEDPLTEDPFISQNPDPGGGDDGSGNPYWEWADAFPGPLSLSATREGGVVVKVKGGYDPIAYSPETPVLQSTGLYAGSDEQVSIEVPEGAVNLKAQIGIGQPLLDISIQTAQRRFRDVTTKFNLESGRENLISSPFGGFLYFYYEPADVPTEGEIDVTVSNVVKSYDFIAGETDVRDFASESQRRAELLLNAATTDDQLNFPYWQELRSDEVILTFGAKEMKYLTNAERLLEVYGNMRDAYLEFGGWPTDDKQPPMRLVSDIQLPNPNQQTLSQDEKRYGGYPMGVVRSTEMRKDEWRFEKDAVNETGQLEFKGNRNIWIPYSFGMTVLGDWATASWMKFPLLWTANIYYANTKLNSWLPAYYNLQYDRQLAANRFSRYKSLHHYSMVLKNCYSNNPNATDAYNKNKDFTRDIERIFTSMFIQLATEYGWKLYAYVNQRALELEFENEYDQDCYDFFAMAACEYTGKNLIPFFRWWNYPLTQYAQDFMKQFDPLEGSFIPGDTPYWFAVPVTDPTPEIPLDNPVQTPPQKQIEWPAKPYYQFYVKAAKVWKVNNDNSGVFCGPRDQKIGSKTYKPGDRMAGALNDLANLVDNVLNNASQFGGLTAGNLGTLINNRVSGQDTVMNCVQIEISFDKELTFNTLEIMQAGDPTHFFTWIYDVQVFVTDEDNPDGHWIYTDDNRPWETGDYYTGVYWLPRHYNTDDNRKNCYTSYLDKTFTASKLRFKADVDIGERRGGAAPRLYIREVDVGLISTDIPKETGTMPFPFRNWLAPSIRSYDV